MKPILMLALSFVCLAVVADEKFCNYSTYKWNSLKKQAVDYQEVTKLYRDLDEDEIDLQTGCSVCREDQVAVTIDEIQIFHVCKYLAPQIEAAIIAAINSGQQIEKVVGYRVGKSKGELDKHGNRTQFSNHSFGIAIDVNPDHNGLYSNCFEFGAHCRIVMGGKWIHGHPLSLDRHSPLVREMSERSFKWGGEILGKQKDFMHFSISGY